MSSIYRRATHKYMGMLGVACLIISPFIGAGALVIWLLTAMTLYGFLPSKLHQKTDGQSFKKKCQSDRRPRC